MRALSVHRGFAHKTFTCKTGKITPALPLIMLYVTQRAVWSLIRTCLLELQCAEPAGGDREKSAACLTSTSRGRRPVVGCV